MDPNQTVGAKIKALRTEKKYTLKTLSGLTGFSVGFLSQLERGISSIAVDSLAKIAKCLDVPLSTFFETEPPDMQDPVVHSFAARQSMVSPQIIQSVLSHDTLAFDFLPRHFLLMPFSDPDTPAPELYTHAGEEFVYVLAGVVSLWLENSRYTLYPGDSIQIHSNQPHNWANNTNKVAELLSINYPNPLRQDQAAGSADVL